MFLEQKWSIRNFGFFEDCFMKWFKHTELINNTLLIYTLIIMNHLFFKKYIQHHCTFDSWKQMQIRAINSIRTCPATTDHRRSPVSTDNIKWSAFVIAAIIQSSTGIQTDANNYTLVINPFVSLPYLNLVATHVVNVEGTLRLAEERLFSYADSKSSWISILEFAFELQRNGRGLTDINTVSDYGPGRIQISVS